VLKLDDNFLKEIGLGDLPPDEKKKMLAHVYETLEMRVGTKLANKMSDAQLQEFESLMSANDEAGALKWLETNIPNYKDVVSAELSSLKKEISDNSSQILAASAEN
jgi:hypothetical protein